MWGVFSFFVSPPKPSSSRHFSKHDLKPKSNTTLNPFSSRPPLAGLHPSLLYKGCGKGASQEDIIRILSCSIQSSSSSFSSSSHPRTSGTPAFNLSFYTMASDSESSEIDLEAALGQTWTSRQEDTAGTSGTPEGPARKRARVSTTTTPFGFDDLFGGAQDAPDEMLAAPPPPPPAPAPYTVESAPLIPTMQMDAPLGVVVRAGAGAGAGRVAEAVPTPKASVQAAPETAPEAVREVVREAALPQEDPPHSPVNEADVEEEEEDDEDRAKQWKLDAPSPRVFLIRASLHLGVTLNTERLSQWVWNCRYFSLTKRLEHVDRHGNTFNLFASGKVSVSTTGLVVAGGKGLRRQCRCFARMVQRALYKDRDYAGDMGVSLTNPAHVKFLGYRINNIWGRWKPCDFINITQAQDALNTPEIRENLYVSVVHRAKHSYLAVVIAKQDIKVDILPDGNFNFVKCQDETAMFLTAAFLYQAVVKPQRETAET